MSQFEINGVSYQARRIPAMQQMNLSARLLPVVSSLIALRGDAEKTEDGEAVVKFEQLAAPIANAIAAMSDADREFIISTCLSVVQRKKAGDTGYISIWNAAAKAPQFDDIDMLTMIMIAWNVIAADLGPFMSALPSASLAKAKG